MTSLGSTGRAAAHASASITSFLERVYWSMGETLPHELLNSNWNRFWVSVTLLCDWVVLSHTEEWSECRELLSNQWMNYYVIMLRLEVQEAKLLDTEAQRQKLLQALVNTAMESDLSRGVVWTGPRDLPRRWLPHGSYFDLYTLYCSHQLASSEPAASKTTFYRTLKESQWKKKIKFSPPSSHSKCSTCARLKGQIQNATGIQAHTEACDKLLRHLSGQFSDRACYWECRSRAKTTSDLLCLISDSMDRSKYALPRFHRGSAKGYWNHQKTNIGDDDPNCSWDWNLHLLVRWRPNVWVKLGTGNLESYLAISTQLLGKSWKTCPTSSQILCG